MRIARSAGKLTRFHQLDDLVEARPCQGKQVDRLFRTHRSSIGFQKLEIALSPPLRPTPEKNGVVSR